MAKKILHNIDIKPKKRVKRDFFLRNISGSVTVAQRVGGSRFEMFFQRLSMLLSYTSVRAYGLFLLGFGLLSVVSDFVKDYLKFFESTPFASLIAGAIVSIIAIPLALVDKPVAIATQEHMLADYIIHEFFCIKRVPSGEGARGIPTALMLVFGLVLGILSNFVSFIYILVGLFGILYIRLAMVSPEFSFFGIFLALPYFSLFDKYGIVLSALIVVTLVSYFRRVILGKRVFSLEQYDIVLCVMLLLIFAIGLFTRGVQPFYAAMLVILLTLGYTLAGNLVTNRRLADAAIHALIISSVPISVIALVQFIKSAASGVLVGGVATFSSPEALAAFLIAPLAFSIYFVTVSTSVGGRILYSFISLLVAAALFSTLSVFSLLALLVGVCANLFSRIRHGSGIFLAALMLGPYLLVLLPSSVIAEISAVPFFEDIRLSEVLTRWRESFSLIGESFFTGQGIGEWGHAGASNLLLEMLAETGIFTLFVFLFLTALRCIHSSKYQRYVRRSQVREVSYMCTTVIAALFALGVFTDIFSDVATYYLFWCIFGIGSATMRIAKRERDDRVGYFTDGSDVDSSSIDITIRQ